MMPRRGWTLHEMLISLAVMGGVFGLAVHLALGQMRFVRSASELSAVRLQAEQATRIASAVLWSVSPVSGDILVALDSALEVRMSVGVSAVCASQPGRATIPSAEPLGGNTLTSFVAEPSHGDGLAALFQDSLGTTWLTLRVSQVERVSAPCGYFSRTSDRALTLVEPIVLPPGTPVLVTRRVRLSLYRGSDAQWYFGSRDWNAELDRFNTTQPVAGPLRAYSGDAARTGLRFTYTNSAGDALSPPVDLRAIAGITITARAARGELEDSSIVTLALRNAR
jgi:type II secretory pathway pseudopilin PulG